MKLSINRMPNIHKQTPCTPCYLQNASENALSGRPAARNAIECCHCSSMQPPVNAQVRENFGMKRVKMMDFLVKHEKKKMRVSISGTNRAISKICMRKLRVQQRHHHCPERVKIDWLGQIISEACLCSSSFFFGHGIRRESHDWHWCEVVSCFPLSDVVAGLVPILDRHLYIALR